MIIIKKAQAPALKTLPQTPAHKRLDRAMFEARLKTDTDPSYHLSSVYDVAFADDPGQLPAFTD